MIACRDCAEAVEHCHATVLIHEDGTLECTSEGPCRLPLEAHAMVTACSQILPACRCGPVGPTGRDRRAVTPA